MLKHNLCASVVSLLFGGQVALVNAENLPSLDENLNLTVPKATFELNGNHGSLSAEFAFIGSDDQGELLWRLVNYQVDSGEQPMNIGCDDNLVERGESRTLTDRRDGVDYVINCKTHVNGDLIIEPAVTLQFGTDDGIEVGGNGSIQAEGTAEQPVIFTGEDKLPGAWLGLIIESSDIKNRLEHIVIEYAGGGEFNSNGDLGALIVWADSRLKLHNSRIQHSAAWGFNAPYGGSELELVDNTFSNNEAPMQLEPPYVDMISGGHYRGNNQDAIFVISGDTISDQDRWKALEVPYQIEGHIRVTGGELTIDPGTTMRFANGGQISMGDSDKSSLIAVGTPTEPITFTAVNPLPGAWEGIIFNFTNSPLNEIGFATIEYAGTNDNPGAIYMWAAPVLNVHDVTFRGIEHCALYAAPGSSAPNENLRYANLMYETVNQEFCEV